MAFSWLLCLSTWWPARRLLLQQQLLARQLCHLIFDNFCIQSSKVEMEIIYTVWEGRFIRSEGKTPKVQNILKLPNLWVQVQCSWWKVLKGHKMWCYESNIGLHNKSIHLLPHSRNTACICLLQLHALQLCLCQSIRCGDDVKPIWRLHICLLFKFVSLAWNSLWSNLRVTCHHSATVAEPPQPARSLTWMMLQSQLTVTVITWQKTGRRKAGILNQEQSRGWGILLTLIWLLADKHAINVKDFTLSWLFQCAQVGFDPGTSL